MSPTKPTSLQQAASAVFGVTTVVPLLVFVWTLHRLGALAHIESQVGLGLALGIALLGYYIFRRLMGQMSQLIQGLGRVVQQGMRPAGDANANLAAAGKATGLITEYKPPVRDASAEPAPTARVAQPAMAHAAVAGGSTPTPRPAAPVLEPVPPPVHRSAPIPGLGMIQEVDDLSHAMAKLWMAEALGYKGQRVALTIMNARAPLTGTLVDVTHDELVLDQGGTRVTVNYGRLSGIDAA
jgi:hypothetical protein